MEEEWDRKRLQAWLKGKPRDVMVAVATRAALRAAPFLASNLDHKSAEKYQSLLTLTTFRCILAASVAAVGSTEEVIDAAAAAADAARATTAAADARATIAADAAADAFAARADAFAAAAADAARAGAFVAATAFAAAAFWQEIGYDIGFLAENNAVALLGRPLWATSPSDKIRKYDQDLTGWLNATPGFAFWPRWYRGIVAGAPMNWDIQREIALIPNEVWEEGPEAVAVEIERIEARYRQRATSSASAVSSPIDIQIVSQRLRDNRDALSFTTAALLEEIVHFKEKTRASNSLDPEVRDGLLAFLDGLHDGLTNILSSLPFEDQEVVGENAEEVASWLSCYKSRVVSKFREYSTPENVGDATVPISIILGCTGVGSLLGMPIAGSIAGGLITGQLKPGQAADKLLKPPSPE